MQALAMCHVFLNYNVAKFRPSARPLAWTIPFPEMEYECTRQTKLYENFNIVVNNVILLLGFYKKKVTYLNKIYRPNKNAISLYLKKSMLCKKKCCAEL